MKIFLQVKNSAYSSRVVSHQQKKLSSPSFIKHIQSWMTLYSTSMVTMIWKINLCNRHKQDGINLVTLNCLQYEHCIYNSWRWTGFHRGFLVGGGGRSSLGTATASSVSMQHTHVSVNECKLPYVFLKIWPF